MVRSLVTKDMQICPQERTMSTMKTKTSSLDNKNVLNFKQKHRKAEKSITSEQEPITRLLVREIWDFFWFPLLCEAFIALSFF